MKDLQSETDHFCKGGQWMHTKELREVVRSELWESPAFRSNQILTDLFGVFVDTDVPRASKESQLLSKSLKVKPC